MTNATTLDQTQHTRHHEHAHDTARRRVAVIGSGTMGRAIAGGMLRAGVVGPGELLVTDRVGEAAASLAGDLVGARVGETAAAWCEADIVILCVKPKDVADVLGTLPADVADGKAPLVISIAAGVTIAALESGTRDALPVIRAMPNTPCLIGHGMTVLSRGARATDAHLASARAIFESLGRCLVLDERHLDAITAVSASGPAFVYLVIEALADGGVMCGLPRAVATEVVAQMTLGAAAMVLTTGKHPAVLKDDVTTPAGCTITGLLTLEDGKVRSVFARAVEVARQSAAGLAR